MPGKKFHIHIKATTPEEIKKELEEVGHILTGLRENTKKWRQSYGSRELREKERWENKADQWIEDHKIIIEDDNS